MGTRRAPKKDAGEPGSEKKPRAPRKPKKPAAVAPTPLGAKEVGASAPTPAVDELARAVDADGGAVLARYREPYGGNWVLLIAVPIDKVEPTPYQRDVSPAHVAKLSRSIQKVGRFLDPMIAVRHEGRYWVPNGGHRLEALKAAGATTAIALLIPEAEVARKILALNTEKAHNLKERALEVIRLERGLANLNEAKPEKEFELEFEEGSLLTLGAAYQKRPRISGGAYSPLLRKCDPLTDKPVKDAVAWRDALADKLLVADDRVGQIVDALKSKGFKSPYLRPFVVSRITPINRFAKNAPIPPVDEALDKLAENAAKFDTNRVRETDLASASGPPPEEGAE
jgi:ParB family chromosome partitioning protein